MQDRFKFRVWSDKENKMYKVHSLHFGTNKAIVTSLYGNASIKLDDKILMQSTSLKDKNDKLIYENDIVKTSFDNEIIIGVITWDCKELKYYLNSTDYYGDKYVTDFEIYNTETYQVIGNIYENAELLEE